MKVKNIVFASVPSRSYSVRAAEKNSGFCKKNFTVNSTGYASVACFVAACAAGMKKWHLLHRYFTLAGIAFAAIHLILSRISSRCNNLEC